MTKVKRPCRERCVKVRSAVWGWYWYVMRRKWCCVCQGVGVISVCVRGRRVKGKKEEEERQEESDGLYMMGLDESKAHRQ